MSEFSSTDRRHMRRALELAARGMTTTTPNPAVGCVIADADGVIAESYHRRAGEAHAEALALAEAGEKARGSTVYVTLEPCTVDGRTPPCVDALISAAVGEVVYALEDPNPEVRGRGKRQLEAAGIRVRDGLLAEFSRALNEGYVSRQTRGRPFVTMKWAQSLDGASAMASGESQWITGPQARSDAHRLRARACAILTGVGTVLADDPMMTARSESVTRQPLRVIADSQWRTPPNAKILLTDGDALVVGTGPCENSDLEQGATCWSVPEAQDRRVDLRALLERLAASGINELMVEAGATLSGALLNMALVDRLVIYMAPMLLGSETRRVIETPDWLTLASGRRFAVEDVRTVGEDLRLQMTPRPEIE
ncbi:MAG: bifunctional diaminohydroxyphosphoribosylaminopyrimidine deaminase/5-amino-6-(5-phosphoribosylamino)uracil reductase RibD [Pseudomonadota bacterium]